MAELRVYETSGAISGIELRVLETSGSVTAATLVELRVLETAGSVTASAVANAGPDLTVPALVPVTLANYSPFATSWDWEVIAGSPSAVVSDGETPTPTIIPPADPDGTTITVRLTVNGGSTDTMTITTPPHLHWRLEGTTWRPYRKCA